MSKLIAYTVIIALYALAFMLIKKVVLNVAKDFPLNAMRADTGDRDRVVFAINTTVLFLLFFSLFTIALYQIVRLYV